MVELLTPGIFLSPNLSNAGTVHFEGISGQTPLSDLVELLMYFPHLLRNANILNNIKTSLI